MDPYRALANAIVEQAVKDYREALREGDDLRELEQFFRSQWYRELTDLDGETIMRKVRESL